MNGNASLEPEKPLTGQGRGAQAAKLARAPERRQPHDGKVAS